MAKLMFKFKLVSDDIPNGDVVADVIDIQEIKLTSKNGMASAFREAIPVNIVRVTPLKIRVRYPFN